MDDLCTFSIHNFQFLKKFYDVKFGHLPFWFLGLGSSLEKAQDNKLILPYFL